MSLDVAALRAQFPALEQSVNGRPLVYLDSAATALKPRRVIEAVESVYASDCANIHRAVHALSQRATARYEGARDLAQRFLGAASRAEVVYTRGTTDGINLVAQSYGGEHLREGDEILLTELEHHSNIVPWQLVAARTGAVIQVVPITDEGEVRLEDFEAKLSPRTKIVSITHASNALGTVLPVAAMAERAHAAGAVVVVDGAQGAPHLPVDVAALGCDFYAFSGHKIYGPSGIGILWGRESLLDAMPPYQGGGDMIDHVSFEGTTWNEIPYKFEAGTPPIASAVGLGEALEFFMELDHDALIRHEQDVLAYATERLRAIEGVRLIGTAREKVAVQSFLLEGTHPSDVGTVLDGFGIAVRTGHHCAQPVMERFGVPATARASFGVYNTREDVDALAHGLEQVKELFGGK